MSLPSLNDVIAVIVTAVVLTVAAGRGVRVSGVQGARTSYDPARYK